MIRKILPLLIVLAGIAVFALLKATRPEPAAVTATERSWRVAVQEVELATRVPVLALYGEVAAPDQQRITATLAGRVAEKSVSDGVRVHKGDLLLALDEADIGPAMDQARSQVADLEAQVRSEDVRYQNDQKALKSEKAILENARRQHERVRSLVDRNLASRENLEAATDGLARAELTVTSRERAIDEHPARLQSLEAKLTQARANLASVELDSDRARVRAPFEGVVTDVQVAVGDQVSPNQALFTLYPLAGLEVRARVPQVFQAELMAALERGEKLMAQSDDGQPFRLARFAGLSDAAGTEAVLELQGEPGALRPGALRALTLERPARDNTIAVPFSTIYGADSVYIMTDDNRMQRVPVQRIGEALSENGERRLLIASDQLRPGMRLITTHLPNAITGLKVELADDGGEPEA